MDKKIVFGIFVLIIIIGLIYFSTKKETVIENKSELTIKYLDENGNVIDQFSVPFTQKQSLMTTIEPEQFIPYPIPLSTASIEVTVNVHNSGTVPLDISVKDISYSGEFYGQ